jgi:hypothetical protein
MIEFDKKVYPAGLIDGIEVMNHLDFYPRAIDRAEEYGLFMSSNSDLHTASWEYYGNNGSYRNMTFIFAKDKSLESLKEALKARRTLAYSFGTIAGERQLLEDFFKASVRCVPVQTTSGGDRTVMVVNESSLPYYLNYNGDPMKLNPFGALSVTVKKGASLKMTVENMWHGSTEHLEVEYHF